MPELTDAELTVLGLVGETPRHGYELARVIQARGVRDWTALGSSSIYYVLERLAARGLVEAVAPATGPKARVTYRATPAGLALLADESLAALVEVAPVHARVLVALANSPGLPPADVAAGLRARLVALDEATAGLTLAEARTAHAPPAARAIVDYARAQLAADRAWTQATLATLGKG